MAGSFYQVATSGDAFVSLYSLNIQPPQDTKPTIKDITASKKQHGSPSQKIFWSPAEVLLKPHFTVIVVDINVVF